MNGGVISDWTGGAWEREEARRMGFVMEVESVNRNSVDGLEKMISFHTIRLKFQENLQVEMPDFPFRLGK